MLKKPLHLFLANRLTDLNILIGADAYVATRIKLSRALGVDMTTGFFDFVAAKLIVGKITTS